MRTRKARTDFSGYKDVELGEKGREILDSLQDNKNFPTLQDAVKQAEKVLAKYVDALAEAREKPLKENIDAKNNLKTMLMHDLSHLAGNANLISDGNEQMLRTTAFDLNKLPDSGKLPDIPHAFELGEGGIGAVTVKIDAIKQATGYIVMYRKEGDEQWEYILLSKTTGIVENLQSVCRYEFKVAATNATTNSFNRYNFTEVKTRVVQ